jgi:protein-S-isoprenylcysteine O-methyltransferase Ste14
MPARIPGYQPVVGGRPAAEISLSVDSVARDGRQNQVMRVVDLVIVVGWAAFWLYWLVEARNVKAGRTGGWNRLIGVRVALIVVIVFLFRFAGFGQHKGTADPWLAGIGVAVWALGLALAVWARLYIGRNWGMPMTQKENPELVTTGPYHAIRHPIYTGIILAAVGTALATSPFGLIVVAVLAGYFIYSALNEERYMTELFPSAYPDYRQHSKMLIPFVL